MLINELIQEYKQDYPIVASLKDTIQDSEWHAEGDVEIHTQMVINEALKIAKNHPQFKEELVLGAFFHDIGKVYQTKESERDGRIRIVAPKHEENGYNYLVHKFIDDLRIPRSKMKNILTIVGFHQIPKLLVIKNASKWSYLRARKIFNPELLYLFELADIKGRTSQDRQDQIEYLELFKMQMIEYGFWEDDYRDPILKMLVENKVEKKHWDFLYQKAMYHLMNGDIYDPVEILFKYYESIENGYAKVILPVGLSGVGKSTWSKKQYSNATIISLDEIRDEFSKHRDRKYEGQVMQEAKVRLKSALASNKTIIYDATNLRMDFRDKVYSETVNYNAFYRTHILNMGLKKVIKQDGLRERSVGEIVIFEQEKKYQDPIFDFNII